MQAPRASIGILSLMDGKSGALRTVIARRETTKQSPNPEDCHALGARNDMLPDIRIPQKPRLYEHSVYALHVHAEGYTRNTDRYPVRYVALTPACNAGPYL